MTEPRNERLYLNDIRSAIDRILEYTSGGRDAFLSSALVQDAVVRNIEILGEAVKGVRRRQTVPAVRTELRLSRIPPCG
jgi:uncharacterized protein with HEPN domain